MAGTEFSEVFDLFMVNIKDWRLQQLWETSVDDFENYLFGFLKKAIVKFMPICTQSLEYDEDQKEFNETLTLTNQEMLAQIMVVSWLEKEVQDVTQMNLHLQDRDFKIYSESQNLREKSLHLDKTREIVSLAMSNYTFNYKTDWSQWFQGTFYTP